MKINKRSFNHLKIDQKWQARWESEGVFKVEDFPKRPYYCLIEFPYPSGEGLHVGHPRSYTALDIVARKRRMEGFDVLYPIGYDAFGLPAENFAIKKGVHPSMTTKKNIDRFRCQLKSMGFSFDWSREVNTTDPTYYRWTQWIFLQFVKAGLAYKATVPINWCPSCKIGLANEEVVGGRCERCGSPVEMRKKEQWMLRITAYADRLLSDLNTVDYLPKIKAQQEHWIGKSEGARIPFEVEGGKRAIEVFTTRPDTLYGATYLVLAPEHPLVNEITAPSEEQNVRKLQETSAGKTLFERTETIKEKTGAWTGAFALHPITGERLPIWIADYVVMHYGSGAVMAVPAHDQRDFEFAKRYGLPIKSVLRSPHHDGSVETCFEGHGTIIHSELFEGLASDKDHSEVLRRIEARGIGKRATAYRLRDWVFSRQHYWGEPIPMIHCDHCGWVPVPEDQLPVELPYVEKYQPTDTGESPLASMTEWLNVPCPKCGKPGRRETDTMPNWAGSSWYFLRYIDPHNNQHFADFKKLKHWMPVDLYNGGMEHTTLHLLYSRFWNKFLFDQGLVPTSEPYQHRHSHGLILGEGGVKMSKSKGNVVNPDDLVEEFGADTLRMYLMFIGPFEEPAVWNTAGVIGIRRFLDKVHACGQQDWKRVLENAHPEIERLLHQTIQKVSDDIEHFRFNTAVSQLMIFMNAAAKSGVTQTQFETFIVLLSPFAPHLCEELWEQLGHAELVVRQAWPTANAEALRTSTVVIVVQVNGKLRDRIQVEAGLSKEKVEALVLELPSITKYVPGGKASLKKMIFIPDRLVNLVV